MIKRKDGPKILILDIETSYLEVATWGIFDQFIPPDAILKDWTVLAWSAKWYGDPESKTMYQDNRGKKNIRDDKALLIPIRDLLDECDVALTQNGKAFDIPKLMARFKINKIDLPSSFKHIDTKVINKKHFGFTSNSLDYLSKTLGLKHQKLKHGNFPGRTLWDECLADNLAAWKEMKRYNMNDVWTLEDLYNEVAEVDTSVNLSLYYSGSDYRCARCGGKDFRKYGFDYAKIGQFQRYQCKNCNKECKDRTNLLSPLKKKNMKVGITR